MKLPNNNWIINSPLDMAGLDMRTIRVILYAVPRSGSTLLHQILQLMFPEGGIIRTHQFIPPPQGAWGIVSCRDFRDCIMSYCRYRLPHIEHIGLDEARVLAGWFSQFAALVLQYHLWDVSHALKCLSMIRYENHWGDPLRAYSLLSSCPFPDAKVPTNHDLAKLSREIQRPRVDAGKSIWMDPGHIGEGATGMYKSLDDPVLELMERILAPHLVFWGYTPKF